MGEHLEEGEGVTTRGMGPLMECTSEVFFTTYGTRLLHGVVYEANRVDFRIIATRSDSSANAAAQSDGGLADDAEDGLETLPPACALIPH